MEFIIIIFLQAIISAIFSGVIANAKKLDVGIWVIAGLVFGIFGLIASAGMPQYFLPEKMKCPKCNESLVLDSDERRAGVFTCSECNNTYSR